MRNFPDQTILQKDKTPEWCSLHLDYAQDLWRGSNILRDKMNSDFKSYNGQKDPDSLAYLTKTYGKSNRAKYISYRAHLPKIQLRVGEFLSQPLQATVETVNRDSKSAKMEQVNLYYGAMVAKQEILQLKEKAGVDIMEGADIPDNEEDPTWNNISVNDKEEDIMQIILNQQIPALDLKIKFSDDVLNGTITSMVFGKVERDEDGETRYISYDPRDAIFEEVKGDTFLEKSPILGAAPFLTVHDVLKRYKLTTKQITLLKEAAQNPSSYLTRSNGGMRLGNNGGLLVQVMHIEWKSVIPKYYKRVKKTATQLSIDSEVDYLDIELDADAYEKNKSWHDEQENRGKYEVIVKYREDMWEATRIGGLKELDVNMRRAYFQMRSVDDPTRITGGSYTGFLCQTVDGIRISLMNEMENLSNIFDIVMYKILSDVIRAKGKSMGFNLAALHKDSTVEKVMTELFNDGLITYDTSATGNMHGRDVSLNNMIQEFDQGLSQSFAALVQFKNDILDTMDRMTGINENRSGQIQASETVSNNASAIQSSRTITAAFDYGIHLYINKVLTKIVDSTKITWAFFKTEKGEQILGTSKFKFLKVTQELGYKDYAVHLQDGGKYGQVRQFMQGLMEASLNAKEMRPEDALKFMLSETFAGQKAVLEEAWAKIKELEGKSQQAQMANQQQMQQAQLQQQLDLEKARIEDAQAHDIEKIVVQGDTDIRVKRSEMSDQINVNQHKSTLESLNNENI